MARKTPSVRLAVRNESRFQRLYRTDALQRLAQRICLGEKRHGNTPVILDSKAVELSLLFCEDAAIQALNRRYRHKNQPTDVLAFAQTHAGPPGRRRVGEANAKPTPTPGHPVLLGDLVISLETVAGRCGGDRAAMRREIRLLFCHGLLHLLGIHHDTAAKRRAMEAKQSKYLGEEGGRISVK